MVLDTNVLVSALRSRRGASFRLLTVIDSEALQVSLSVPLCLEYEQALVRLAQDVPLTREDVDIALDYVASVAEHRQVFYLWRPILRDPKDDMVLELAVAAQAHAIVTFNKRHFRGVDQFGIRLLTPKELLMELGELQ